MTCQWLKWLELISDTMILNIIPLSPKFVTCITSQWVTQTASDGAMGNAPLPAEVLDPGSGIVFTVHGTCRGKLRMGLRGATVEISIVKMGLKKRCGETMVSVSVPPNGSIMWWLSIQRHQIFGQTLEWRLNKFRNTGVLLPKQQSARYLSCKAKGLLEWGCDLIVVVDYGGRVVWLPCFHASQTVVYILDRPLASSVTNVSSPFPWRHPLGRL